MPLFYKCIIVFVVTCGPVPYSGDDDAIRLFGVSVSGFCVRHQQEFVSPSVSRCTDIIQGGRTGCMRIYLLV